MLGARLVPIVCSQQQVERVIVLAHKNTKNSARPFDSKPANLEIVEGDISEVDLGLDAASRQQIASSVSTIIHGAAETSFSVELNLARGINVTGTENLLRLAAACPRLRGVCHLSTVYVAGRRTGAIRENELEHDCGFVNNYEHSKYEAEEMLRSHADWLPIAVVRLSTVLGDSRDGEVTKLGALHHALRFFFHSLAPFVPGTEASMVDMVALDYAAGAVAALALPKFAAGATWHVCGGADSLTLAELLDLTLQLFYEYRPAWRKRAIEKPAIVNRETFELFVKSVEELGESTLKDSVAVFKNFAPQLSYPKLIGDEATRDVLENAGVLRPAIRDFYPKVIRFLLESNWQPAARAHAEAVL